MRDQYGKGHLWSDGTAIFTTLPAALSVRNRPQILSKFKDANGLLKPPDNKKPAVSLQDLRVFVRRRTLPNMSLVVIGGFEPPTPAL
jgi:hypothetical protein